jgi:hypothetical protein
MVCCGAPAPQEKGYLNNGSKDTNPVNNNDIQKLQQQLQDIKEQVCFHIRTHILEYLFVSCIYLLDNVSRVFGQV